MTRRQTMVDILVGLTIAGALLYMLPTVPA